MRTAERPRFAEPLLVPNSKSLCNSVDRSPQERPSFVDSSPYLQESHPTFKVVQINEADEAHARRSSVETVMELYVFVKADRLGTKVNAAVLADLKSMRFGSGADLWDWYLTIGTMLSRMRRACGLCRPIVGMQRACVHAAEIEEAAYLKLVIKNEHQVEITADSQLGSQTRRRRLNRAQLTRTEENRVTARHRIEEASAQRRSIVHRATYAEGIELFVKVCSKNRAYCFREE